VKLVISMAGRGKRFIDAGIKTPKMLVPVRGRTMMEWALAGLSFIPPEDMIFIILKEHATEWQIDVKLRELFGERIMIKTIPDVTAGQACTVAEARGLYDMDESIIIYNIDTYFKSETVKASINNLGGKLDGFIGVFRSDSPSYSYAAVSKEGYVTRVAEKEVISEWATSGLYAFARASDFLCALEESMERKDTSMGEYYVGPLYNLLANKGARIGIDVCSKIYDLGRPEKLKEFEEARDV
jgi:NDP-sugar pyrophosphorylase family protein